MEADSSHSRGLLRLQVGLGGDVHGTLTLEVEGGGDAGRWEKALCLDGGIRARPLLLTLPALIAGQAGHN